uniref:Centrosomal protein kizuna n=1 Tax=Neogobius melanostomus TaxID=47308 RepID=A0A8C6TAN8_9GOBI
MNYNGEQYYEKITSIQQSLHERERRRLELERELFVYCRSDKRISQMKCSKLCSYLREISDREERAKRRNLELLRNVEYIENSMKKYQPNQDPLLQKKTEVMNMISKFMDARKINNPKTEAAKVTVMPRQGMSFTDPANTPTKLSVMGQQTRDGLTSARSDHILHHSSKSRVQIHEHLQRGLLKESRANLEDPVSEQACLSDDISSSNNPPYGCNLRDKYERTTAELQNVCAFKLDARNVPSLSNEHEPLPPVILTVPEEKQSPCSSGPMGAENPIVEKTDPKETTTQPLGEEEERGLIPDHTPGKKCLLSPESCESSLSSEIDLSLSKSSALSISLTQSELEEDLPESEAAVNHDLIEETDNHYQHCPKSSLHSDRSDGLMEGVAIEGLSLKGLYKLLDTIEERLHAEQSRVYSNPSLGTKELNRLISLCNCGGDLNGEDPKACGAVVLHELQKLSWSTEKGCLLPPDLVNAHQSCTAAEISACLLPDAAQLWDRWFKHALLLKERGVLSTEHLVQLFTPLLLERHATYGHQAKVLLRTLLSRSSEECPSAEDESDVSSFGPAPLPTGGVAVRPLLNQYSPELQSSEEGSQDESPVESVPIRESKAYQLLKQSAMQKRILNFKEEEDNKEDIHSGISDDHEEDLGWAKRSLHQDPYPRMEELNSKVSSALQSKAFWRESDDSNSEIEAALRPQPFSTNNVDTEDFYN